MLQPGESVQAGSARSEAAFLGATGLLLLFSIPFFLFLNCYSEDAHTQQSPLWQMSLPAPKATDGATLSLPASATSCNAVCVAKK